MNELATTVLIVVVIVAVSILMPEVINLIRAAKQQFLANMTREQQQTWEVIVRQTVDAANRERLLAVLRNIAFDAETWAVAELKYRFERAGIRPDWAAIMVVLKSQIYRSYQAAMNKQQSSVGGTRGLAMAPTTDQMAEALWAGPTGQKSPLN